jgi:hypothetical protein
MNTYISFMSNQHARGKCDKIDLVKLDDMEFFLHSIHIYLLSCRYIFSSK